LTRKSLFFSNLVAWLIVISTICAVDAAAQMSAPYLQVDTTQARLILVEDGRPMLTLDDIAIGRGGTSTAKRRGDGTTPLGRYRVSAVRRGGFFDGFIVIDYPSPADAARGLGAGVISAAEYRAIVRAHAAGQLPPQDTALGGHLGIHGLGQGDRTVHAAFNWTRGCIAVTNEQFDALLGHVTPGMVVEVR
jgi:murein L,D-transpeptidase YafK